MIYGSSSKKKAKMVVNNHIHFTEKTLADLPIPTDKNPVIYYDDVQDGLRVKVTYDGAKTYYYAGFIDTPKSVEIGRVGTIKLVDARMKARKLTEADRCDYLAQITRTDLIKFSIVHQKYALEK
jgi:hypothetical protein